MHTLITVIIYGKKPIESLTLNKLLELKYDNYQLLLVNNGPELIEPNDSFLESFSIKKNKALIINYTDNKALSFIYNMVLNDYEKHDRFVFFDDDSDIDDGFFESLDATYNNMMDLQLPLIFDNDNAYYPIIDGVIYSDEKSANEKIGKYNDLFSIGSGLIIYSNLVKKFQQRNMKLFDDNFALYGVDYSFFRRIAILKNKHQEDVNVAISSKINHSLSRTSNEYSSWRHKERLLDIVLTQRYYSKGISISTLILFKLILKEALKLRLKNIYLIISTFIIGCHPRCR
ncbi:glycosyltransferase [Klebsiella quasipneumoniae]|uniref:glycosyl transferase n=2 Tax=Klebsiella quasipneumoniae TaxID=1463165 RepID=UPI001033CDD6|nr:glycosyl transferase [Klebsiella quasipneumoniae]HBR1454548.1 hypothetical protein [Klebsiella quasipneumoniae subsp. similipneumoniae]HBR1665548.1 hypothetical protein [Klebsiella quasipneumoniae subsp. quasipneumoniae]MDX7655792.1 hypothetical protein [Klebsiella quasipneumoniae]VGF62718.1 glycosyltransferase [Klebsiella quasipneumoniae]HDT0537622.1 hypothetical protein [Klebsiella quasipneumoniae subsp. similipneumoniae]